MIRNLFLFLTRFILLKKTNSFLFKHNDISFPTSLPEIGLYLHIPFCYQICPFCPYNKIVLNKDLAHEYEPALIREINLYKNILESTPLNSLYIGGGTPTTMVDRLGNIIGHIKKNLNLGSEIGIEIHPNDVNTKNLQELKEIGVNMISLGVQSFNDKYLKMMGRNYNGKTAEKSLRDVLANNFKTVDIDLLFALPSQTIEEIKMDISKAFALGVNQVSCYPLIVFSFTRMPKILEKNNIKLPNIFQEKRMLDEIINLAEKFGYERTSIWTFTKKSSPRYTSVTREFFVGLGAGATSYIPGYFYINTFSIEEYIKATKTRLPIALVSKLTKEEQMGWWLFWRFYDTYFFKERFKELFNLDVHQVFDYFFKILNLLGISQEDKKTIKLTRMGAFLFHLVEQQYSLSYLNKTWETLSKNPWPNELKL